MFIFRATVSAVSCLVVPAFICIHLLCSFALKLNDDDDSAGIVMNLLTTLCKKIVINAPQLDSMCYRLFYMFYAQQSCSGNLTTVGNCATGLTKAVVGL